MARPVGKLVAQPRTVGEMSLGLRVHCAAREGRSARGSGRFENDVWNVLFTQHDVESRYILGHELLKVLLTFIALLFKHLLDSHLLGGGRKIGAATDFGGQVADFLEQHRRPSRTILASSS